MSLDREQLDLSPVTSTEELVAAFRAAERPPVRQQLGLEHEKLLFDAASGQPVPYLGERGVLALLRRLADRADYQPYCEPGANDPIALLRGAETISLEPGGQLELSGTPASTAREVHAQNQRHAGELEQACGALGLVASTLGYRPVGSAAGMPWMPKSRYAVMRKVLPLRGPLALDMMLMTATGQVSLDWSSEEDCARKVTLTARISPLLVALYANSPLVDGRPSGFLSFRSHVWTQVDPARCGYFPAMLDGSFRYRAYVDWALDAPMLFLRRSGRYLTPGLTFRRFLDEGFEGQVATAADWADHLSTLFPEVRLKKVLEVRAADCGSLAMTGALPALFRGLLYDPLALEEALALLPRLSFAAHQELHQTAGKAGLAATLNRVPLAEYARQLVGIAQGGLRRLDPEDLPLLEPLLEVARSGRSPAEDVLAAWQRRPDPAALAQSFCLWR